MSKSLKIREFCDVPDTVYLEVTNRCNLNCKHCYALANANSNELEFNEIKRLFEMLSNIGTFGVVLGGGEPLMRKDIIDIIQLANDYNLLVGLSSNGTLVDKNFIDKCKGKISNIQISLDSSKKEVHERFRNKKDIFTKTLQSIKFLSDNDYHVTVATVLLEENCNQIEEIVQLAMKNGAKRYRVMKLVNTGRAMKNEIKQPNLVKISGYLENIKKKYEDEIELEIDNELVNNKTYCTAGRSTISIDYKGDIYPCAFLNNSIFNCGNIKSDNFQSVWNSSQILNSIRKLNDKLNCTSCNMKNKKCDTNCIAVLLSKCFKMKDFF